MVRGFTVEANYSSIRLVAHFLFFRVLTALRGPYACVFMCINVVYFCLFFEFSAHNVCIDVYGFSYSGDLKNYFSILVLFFIGYVYYMMSIINK